MSSWIQMPDGYTFALESMKSIQVNGAALVLTPADGSAPVNWNAGLQANAPQFLTLINAIMTTPAGYTNLLPGTILASVVLDNEDITLCRNILITGYGFNAATVGTLVFDDSSGGQDHDGYYATCTVIDAYHMVATYGGPGNGTLGPGGVLIYYRDANGVNSNVLNGTNPSGTLVTIP